MTLVYNSLPHHASVGGSFFCYLFCIITEIVYLCTRRIIKNNTIMSIQVAVDVPNSPYVDMDDFKKQVADYAKVLYYKMSVKASPSTMKPLEELSPVLQQLCGICSVGEDDINGEVVRSEALKKI